jgi:hypothetical protein
MYLRKAFPHGPVPSDGRLPQMTHDCGPVAREASAYAMFHKWCSRDCRLRQTMQYPKAPRGKAAGSNHL